VKRTPSRPNTLKHLPFFEVLANAPEGSAEARLATAGLLTLRMIDHWVLAGPAIVEPESVSVRSVRAAIMDLPANEPVRESLLTIVNTMQMLRQVDLIPVLPRVFAYAKLLERHTSAMKLSADSYETIVRLADTDMDAELVMDAYDRLAFCRRKTSELDAAARASSAVVKMATARKDKSRALQGKIGVGLVSLLRGDFAVAESQLAAVASDAEKAGLDLLYAKATHNRGVVAFRAGRPADAIVLSHRALKHATDPVDRERVLSDLAAFLIKAEQYEASIDALRILELTAVSEEVRGVARLNLISAAGRAGFRALFDSARQALEIETLLPEFQINALVETARGLLLFGEHDEALRLLDSAAAAADNLSLPAARQEIDRLRTAPPVRTPTESNGKHDSTEVAVDLRRMVEALVPA
jgi:hypothetical protein